MINRPDLYLASYPQGKEGKKQMYIPRNFKTQELVSSNYYKIHGEDSLKSFDENLLIMADGIRDLFSKTFKDSIVMMMVNDWLWNNKPNVFNYRGFREKGCGVGVVTGGHYKGNAIDFNIYVNGKVLDSAVVRQLIIDNKSLFPMLKGIEFVDGWVHVDTMERKGVKEGLIVVFNNQGAVVGYA